jgi:hypothetical protein
MPAVPDTAVNTRLRALALGVAAALAVVVAIVALAGGGDQPPAEDAAKLVPADALVYLNVSTDPGRDAVKRALDLARRFPSFQRVRDSVLQRLSAGGEVPIDFGRDVRPWLGREAALALLPGSGPVAQSLLILDVRDRGKAQAFLDRRARPGRVTTYRGVRVSSYGQVSSAFVGGRLAIASGRALHQAIALSQRRGLALTANPLFQKAYRGLPAGRAADAFLSRDGVLRLLAPQSGALGVAGTLLARPALAAVGAALGAGSGNARLTVETVLDPALARASPSPFQSFEPNLTGQVPGNALAYLGVTGLDRAAGRLLDLAGAGGLDGTTARRLFARLRADVERRTGIDFGHDVLALFHDETALFVLPGAPTPTLGLIARVKDEDATRQTFARIQLPLARLFAAPGAAGGQVPTFQDRDVDGADAFQLRLAPGVEVDYAIFDGKLVLATSLDGIAAVKRHGSPLADAGAFESVLAKRPSSVTSLTFLDFGQLLGLGERTGLGQDRAFLAVRDDLDRVRAAGAATSAAKDQTTAEITISVK